MQKGLGSFSLNSCGFLHSGMKEDQVSGLRQDKKDGCYVCSKITLLPILTWLLWISSAHLPRFFTWWLVLELETKSTDHFCFITVAGEEDLLSESSFLEWKTGKCYLRHKWRDACYKWQEIFHVVLSLQWADAAPQLISSVPLLQRAAVPLPAKPAPQHLWEAGVVQLLLIFRGIPNRADSLKKEQCGTALNKVTMCQYALMKAMKSYESEFLNMSCLGLLIFQNTFLLRH